MHVFIVKDLLNEKKSTNIFFLEFGLTQNMCYTPFFGQKQTQFTLLSS